MRPREAHERSEATFYPSWRRGRSARGGIREAPAAAAPISVAQRKAEAPLRIVRKRGSWAAAVMGDFIAVDLFTEVSSGGETLSEVRP
jgi:hypothetical protein